MGFPLRAGFVSFSDRWASVGGAKFVVVVKTRVCLQQNKTFASLRVCVLCCVIFVTIAKMSIYVQKRKK